MASTIDPRVSAIIEGTENKECGATTWLTALDASMHFFRARSTLARQWAFVSLVHGSWGVKTSATEGCGGSTSRQVTDTRGRAPQTH